MNAMNSRAINAKAINSGTHKTSFSQSASITSMYKLLGHYVITDLCMMSSITSMSGQSIQFKMGYADISAIPSIYSSSEVYIDGFRKLDICSQHCPVYPYDS